MDDLLRARRRLGPLRQLTFAADTFPKAHRDLGRALGASIRRAARQRLAATPAAQFSQQIALLRRCRTWLLMRSAQDGLEMALRAGIREYLDCLTAWGEGARLCLCLSGDMTVDGATVTATELAWWLQGDELGCQTGLLRLADGSVLFWHTEEDMSSGLDRPWLAALTVGGRTHCAFLYPYLLPGPAFGWRPGAFQSLNTLHVRRESDDVGSLVYVAAWLIWRLGDAVSPRRVVEALQPYVDAGAINVVQTRGARPVAMTHECGREHVQTRVLSHAAGSLSLQANTISRPRSRLARVEALDAAERTEYRGRLARGQADVAALLASGRADPDGVIQMLTSRIGGGYANANADVKGYCVGRATAAGIEIFVAAGPACPADRYAPQFTA